MRYYETLYIVNPNYEGDRLDGVLQDVIAEAQKNKISIINHRIWGKKRLAYPIQKQKYGTYILLQFEMENVALLKDFDLYLKMNKALIRYQTIRLKERPEEYAEESGAVEAKPAHTTKDTPEDPIGTATTKESAVKEKTKVVE